MKLADQFAPLKGLALTEAVTRLHLNFEFSPRSALSNPLALIRLNHAVCIKTPAAWASVPRPVDGQDLCFLRMLSGLPFDVIDHQLAEGAFEAWVSGAGRADFDVFLAQTVELEPDAEGSAVPDEKFAVDQLVASGARRVYSRADQLSLF